MILACRTTSPLHIIIQYNSVILSCHLRSGSSKHPQTSGRCKISNAVPHQSADASMCPNSRKPDKTGGGLPKFGHMPVLGAPRAPRAVAQGPWSGAALTTAPPRYGGAGGAVSPPRQGGAGIAASSPRQGEAALPGATTASKSDVT